MHLFVDVITSVLQVRRMAEDSSIDVSDDQQHQQPAVDAEDGNLEHQPVADHESVTSSSSSSSSPTIMAADDKGGGGREVSEGEGSEATVKERAGRVFDIVLPSPTGLPPSNGAIASSALTSPSTPSTSGGWSMSSSTDGTNATLCYGDERLMLTEIGRRFYNRRALSDVKLRVADHMYRCHKLLLALSSDVLERMLCCSDWTDAVKQVRVVIHCSFTVL